MTTITVRGQAAREDAIEIRRRNFIRPEAMPYRIPTGLTYDSGEFARIMDHCLDLAEWKGFAARRAASTERGKLRGRGIAYSLEESGVFNPLGVKGLGEVGSVGAPPAVIHAILDALRPLGIDTIDMPATPGRIREAVRQAQSEGTARA